MGKVTVSITIENYADIVAVALGQREKPRRLQVEAVVDTGATRFYLQSSVVRELGLKPMGEHQSRVASGELMHRTLYSPVSLEIMGRSATFDVIEVDDRVPNLIGQVPLEVMDWVVDCPNQRLIGNPEHGGVWINDAY